MSADTFIWIMFSTEILSAVCWLYLLVFADFPVTIERSRVAAVTLVVTNLIVALFAWSALHP